MFGGQAQRPAHEKTLIERFHSWKQSLRYDIRWRRQSQFTDPAWKDIHSLRAPHKRIAPMVRPLSPLRPVLNSQQLVATWQTHVSISRRGWHTATIPVEVKQEGVYLGGSYAR